MDLDTINGIVGDMPNTALKLMPDDAALLFLVNLLPRPVTKDNARTMLIIMALICRRLSQAFEEMAAEQEKLVQEWQD